MPPQSPLPADAGSPLNSSAFGPSAQTLRRRKQLRKAIPFTIMVCGASGTGKSTFINTLCSQDGSEPLIDNSRRYAAFHAEFDRRKWTERLIQRSINSTNTKTPASPAPNSELHPVKPRKVRSSHVLGNTRIASIDRLQKHPSLSPASPSSPSSSPSPSPGPAPASDVYDYIDYRLTPADAPFDPATADEPPRVSLTRHNCILRDDDGTQIALTVLDTPGFGEQLDCATPEAELCRYLTQQFDGILAEETKLRRTPRGPNFDHRVHLLLYFVEPTGHGLRPLDIQAMKALSKYVNVIPVVGKADSFTPTELAGFKRRIRADISELMIPIYDFPSDTEAEAETEAETEFGKENSFLRSLLPFAVVGADSETEPESGKPRGRHYEWGTVEIDNPEHCDFVYLRNAILGSHLGELKDLTNNFLYERYRTEKLSEVAQAGLLAGTPAEPPRGADGSISSLLELVSETPKLGHTRDDSVSSQKYRSMLDVSDGTEKMPERAEKIAAGPEKMAEEDLQSLQSGNESKNDENSDKLKEMQEMSKTLPFIIKSQQLSEKKQRLQEYYDQLKAELEAEQRLLEEKERILEAQRAERARKEAERRKEGEMAEEEAEKMAEAEGEEETEMMAESKLEVEIKIENSTEPVGNSEIPNPTPHSNTSDSEIPATETIPPSDSPQTTHSDSAAPQ